MNTPTCTDPAHHPIADPWATRNEDGTVTLHWPESEAYALCSRELIEGMVARQNELIAERDEHKRRYDDLFDQAEHLLWPDAPRLPRFP